MKVETDGYSFDFPDALEAFVFDEKDKSKPNYHGMPMKAVDIMVELDNKYLYIEIKEYGDDAEFDCFLADEGLEPTEGRKHSRHLKNYLKYKFRDTFLYRYAEEKVDKPIVYVCLLNDFDNAQSVQLNKQLRNELPVGRKANSRWKRELAINCHVLNLKKWNEVFQTWPAERL